MIPQYAALFGQKPPNLNVKNIIFEAIVNKTLIKN